MAAQSFFRQLQKSKNRLHANYRKGKRPKRVSQLAHGMAPKLIRSGLAQSSEWHVSKRAQDTVERSTSKLESALST